MLAALLLAAGLAMDAAAAGAVRGLTAGRVRAVDVALIAGLCGGFQGGMAALGWLAGARLGGAFARVDHWIAFGVLALLGVKSIAGAFGSKDDADTVAAARPFALRGLLLLALATSIDALAAGVTVPLLPVGAPVALALIAGVTALLTAIATAAGSAIGARLGGKLEVVGGLALIAIGLKILLEHTLA